MIVE
jgi:hypothetical protein